MANRLRNAALSFKSKVKKFTNWVSSKVSNNIKAPLQRKVERLNTQFNRIFSREDNLTSERTTEIGPQTPPQIEVRSPPQREVRELPQIEVHEPPRKVKKPKIKNKQGKLSLNQKKYLP